MTDNILVNNNPNILYLNREADRLKTFYPWTKSYVDKYKLARYGFYFKGPNDTVECVYCKVAIGHWDLGDDPLIEHINWSPSCPFLLHNAPVNVAIDENFENVLPPSQFFVNINYNDEDLIDQANRPIQKIVLPKRNAARHPAYRCPKERLSSFQNWPKSLKQTPQTLSEAGLFYLGKSDHVKCFYCGGALRDWLEDDEPWIEHAKHFPYCDFVKRLKGDQFIEQVKSATEEFTKDLPFAGLMQPVTTGAALPLETKLNWTFSKKCKICRTAELNVIFSPCMHVCACETCGARKRYCPICHKKIIEMKKCFLP